MNKNYALVWNDSQGCWNVAGEGTRRRRKSGSSTVIRAAFAALGMAALSPAYALPTGENVVSGTADIVRSQDGRTMSINQHTDKLVTEWGAFGVGNNERLTFNQPSSSSIALNRVVGQGASAIQGKIDANGRVFLVNPNGIVFGSGAQVNVGGLVASTRNITNEDFDKGNYRFAGDSTYSVINSGTITAAEGGSIALLGAMVQNQGIVQAQMGTVALGAGKDVTLNFDGNKLLSVQVNEGAVDALAANAGLLKADGGQVLMSARSANALLDTVVNNQGSIEARTLRNTAGKIVLDGGDSGTVEVAGAMNASALTTPGNAGTIETRGANVKVALGAMVDTRASNGLTGLWRIASSDVDVAPNATTTGTIAADTLSRSLASTNVELEATQRDVAVNGAVGWDSANRLALVSRQGDVALNRDVNASGANAHLEVDAKKSAHIGANVALTGTNAGMTLKYEDGYDIGRGNSIKLSGAGAGFESKGFRYTVIQNAEQLQNIDRNLNGLYVLGNDIKGGWLFNGALTPIGGSSAFNGVFDGLGNTISNMSIKSSSGAVGLFGVNAGRIANLNLNNVTVRGSWGGSAMQIGGLVGENRGQVHNVSATGMDVGTSSSGTNAVGGLIGVNRGSVAQTYVSGKVTGNSMTNALGGLIGENRSDLQLADVSNSTSAASVSGGGANASIGGLIGVNRGGNISASSNVGSVSGAYVQAATVGGLIGANLAGTIDGSFSTGSVQGGRSGSAGGLVGYNDNMISTSYATGEVKGNGADSVGGFVGTNQGTLAKVRATGRVTGTSAASIGGFAGTNGTSGRIDTAEAFGEVVGGAGRIGGFVGSNAGGRIAHSVARGKTTGGARSETGGFAGNNVGMLTNVEASGNVSGGASSTVGGLVGVNGAGTSGSIRIASATGDVSGGSSSTIGGLVGVNRDEITDARASGTVSSGYQSTLGGLVGINYGSVDRSSASGRLAPGGSLYWKSTYGGLVGVNYGKFRDSATTGAAAAVQVAGVDKGSIE
ncbi:two-partner secretion domain-containing protein [Burkholderia ubonensis]|uniref:two-partner secretion domain-containing protein n=1 Tax=Burkholderia ubonensis TaxID=101571 RepID=UPI002AB02C93|nr:GLUG motif-containing protein [Burkholderia ubonensis]